MFADSISDSSFPYMSTLELIELKNQGAHSLAVLQADTLIGREPDSGGIAVNNSAVSRNHGRFMRVSDYWLFKDLASTNGSWLNGQQLRSEQLCILRQSDILQLADSAFKILIKSPSESNKLPTGRSLLVFKNDTFVEEYHIPEYGRAFVLGGREGDLQFEESGEDLPVLVVEGRGADIVVYGLRKSQSITVNGEETRSTKVVVERDEIKFKNYSFLINCARAVTRMTEKEPPPQIKAKPVVAGGAAVLKEWGSEEPAHRSVSTQEKGMRTHSGRIMFGAISEGEVESDATVAIDSSIVSRRLSGIEKNPVLSRHEEDSQELMLNSLEDRLLIVIGFVMLIALMIGVAVWVFV